MLPNPDAILARLRDLQSQIRDALIASRGQLHLHHVHRSSSADTIYHLDTLVEPIIESFCDEWSRTLPMILIAEGIEPETGRTFPANLNPQDALVQIILDPIDGTRQLMYDKRSAWSLAAVAPNLGPNTRLSHLQIAVMTELPTSKQAYADVLYAIRGHGAFAARQPLFPNLPPAPASLIRPSTAASIEHGFASVSSFFPGAKVLAAQLLEFLASNLIGPADVRRATVFDDQYISTAGQLYELLAGHDRFIADLRSIFYKIQNQPDGLCVHPYDLATSLIASEAGIILTNGLGQPLDGPLDTTTSLSWAGFANQHLHNALQPLINQFLIPKIPQ